MVQGSDTGSRKIVGMDVIGKTVIGRTQSRQTLLQTFDGQAVGRINAGRTQNTYPHAIPRAPGTQAAFSINPAGGSTAFRIQRAGLVDHCTRAIAVDTCRAHVNQVPW